MATRKTLLIGLGVVALVLVAAGASAAIAWNAANDGPKVEEKMAVKPTPKAKDERITWNDSPPARQAPVQPACDDGNVVGHVAGGVVGGIAGNQVGDGNGQTAATIAGTLGGAYLGGRYIPTRNATCR